MAFTIGEGLLSAGQSFNQGMRDEMSRKTEKEKLDELKRQSDRDAALREAEFAAKYGIATPEQKILISAAKPAEYRTQRTLIDHAKVIQKPTGRMYDADVTDQELFDYMTSKGMDLSSIPRDEKGTLNFGDDDLRARIVKQYTEESFKTPEEMVAKELAAARDSIRPGVRKPGELLTSDEQDVRDSGVAVTDKGKLLAQQISMLIDKGYTNETVDEVLPATYVEEQVETAPAEEAIYKTIAAQAEGTERTAQRLETERQKMEVDKYNATLLDTKRGDKIGTSILIDEVNVPWMPKRDTTGRYLVDEFGYVQPDTDAMKKYADQKNAERRNYEATLLKAQKDDKKEDIFTPADLYAKPGHKDLAPGKLDSKVALQLTEASLASLGGIDRLTSLAQQIQSMDPTDKNITKLQIELNKMIDKYSGDIKLWATSYWPDKDIITDLRNWTRENPAFAQALDIVRREPDKEPGIWELLKSATSSARPLAASSSAIPNWDKLDSVGRIVVARAFEAGREITIDDKGKYDIK